MKQAGRPRNECITNLSLDEIVDRAREGDEDVKRQLLFSLAVRLKFPDRFTSNPYPPRASEYMADVLFRILRGENPVPLLGAPFKGGRPVSDKTENQRREAADMVHWLRLDGQSYDDAVLATIAAIESLTGIARTQSYIRKAFGDYIHERLRKYPPKKG